MAFLTEPEPSYGTPEPVLPGLRRLVARNPGPMTYFGTNTWLLDAPDGATVIDPGPDDAAHVQAIRTATDGRVARIVLTHTHPDHVGAAPALKAETGAPIWGWGKPWLADFAPDHALADGDEIAGLTAIHTPGHASDHLCFGWRDGVLFSGDHVMSWNTSIVSPPDGDMAAYLDGLRLLQTRNDTIYCCGHGPVLREPASLLRALLVHRLGREAAVLGALGRAPVTIEAIVEALYTEIAEPLKKAAARSVLAHLVKLEREGKVKKEGDGFVLF